MSLIYISSLSLLLWTRKKEKDRLKGVVERVLENCDT